MSAKYKVETAGGYPKPTWENILLPCNSIAGFVRPIVGFHVSLGRLHSTVSPSKSCAEQYTNMLSNQDTMALTSELGWVCRETDVF